MSVYEINYFAQILECLENETNEILIPEIISRKARKAVERMIAVGRVH